MKSLLSPGSYTVMSWAQHGSATEVIAVLEAELTRKRTRGDAFRSQHGSEPMDYEHPGGVWQDSTANETVQLATYLSDASGCELWDSCGQRRRRRFVLSAIYCTVPRALDEGTKAKFRTDCFIGSCCIMCGLLN